MKPFFAGARAGTALGLIVALVLAVLFASVVLAYRFGDLLEVLK